MYEHTFSAFLIEESEVQRNYIIWQKLNAQLISRSATILTCVSMTKICSILLLL